MKTIVVGDCHGDWSGLMAILRATGAIDADDRRVPDTRVIQLGDLIHGGVPRSVAREAVDDFKALTLGDYYCDEILIGNHELPLVWPDAGFPTWGGQRPLRETSQGIFKMLYRAGKFVPATSVGDWLLTHAGLHHAFVGQTALNGRYYAEVLRDRFARRLQQQGQHPWFDSVGSRRGGHDEYGGIFWLDWRDMTEHADRHYLRQVVGHTPQVAGYASLPRLWCIDSGAALSGLVSAIVTEDDGATWVPVVVESEAPSLATVAAQNGGTR